MKRLRYLSLILLLSGFTNPDSKSYLARWVIEKNCTLTVAGSTNVNTFSCIIPAYSRPDTLVVYRPGADHILKMSGSINLDVQDFDCHNQMMTADLRKTLKVKTFPKLSIRFISLSKFPVQGDACAIKGSVAIVLAGVTKIVDVDYQVRPQGGKAFVLLGTRSINFSDFNLVPPRKIGGMIQTRNELSVAFTLNLKILE